MQYGLCDQSSDTILDESEIESHSTLAFEGSVFDHGVSAQALSVSSFSRFIWTVLR